MRARRRSLAGRTATRPTSPLVMALATASVVLGGCAAGPTQPGADSAPPPASPSASSATPSGWTEPPGHDDDGADLMYTPGAPVPPAAEAASIARRFAERWARPDQPADRWWKALKPLSGPRLAELLRDTDPANVRATKITGDPQATTSVPGDAVFEVPTDTGTLILGVNKTDDGWRVVRIIGFRSNSR